MLIEDHFIINVAKRIQAETADFGPYHEHHLAVELHRAAAATRSQAMERFEEVCKHYPEPEFRCTLTQVVCSGVLLSDSSAK